VTLTYQQESFAAAAEEVRPLAAEDWREMVPYHRAAPYDLDAAKYVALEKAGSLRLYTVRRDARLIGYLCYVVAFGMNSKTTKRAGNTGWWLAPAERRGMTGLRLLDFAEARLKDEGVAIIGTTVMAASLAAAKLLAYRGYAPTETTYTKVLNA
jgi:hypothetical protein